MSPAFHLLDVAIVAAYLATLAAVGVYFSRRQTDLNEFFRARQTMAWLPVGLSLMADRFLCSQGPTPARSHSAPPLRGGSLRRLARAVGASAARDARQQVFVSRIATVAFGMLGTLLATNVSRIGTLLEIANKLINAFAGPLFGIYLLAMFSRKATALPALAGGVAGSVTSYVVAYHSPIGFMWPSTFGLAATLAVGWTLAWLIPARPSAAALQLTWKAVVGVDTVSV